MNKIKLGILREERIPTDRRTPLLPTQCLRVMQNLPVHIVVQPSDVRCFSNKEYSSLGISLQEDLSDCDILIGVKEVPVHLLIPKKTYLIFSHTIKKQAHNKKLLQSIVEKQITLIDYEALVNENNERIIAFGKFAGIVGTYNALLMYGRKFNLYKLKPAHKCFDLLEVKEELKKIHFPKCRILITGGGRVANGCKEILEYINMPYLSPEMFVQMTHQPTAYTQLRSSDYHKKPDGTLFDRVDFFSHPEKYKSIFSCYYPVTDILLASAYWNPASPPLFIKEEIKSEAFKIKIIADITCDIGGSIPSTIRSSTIHDPFYDYNKDTGLLESPFSDDKNITVMAIDNLPGELPRDASEDFGQQLIQNVLPHVLASDKIIESGTITKNGKLTSKFLYLQTYSQ